MERHIPLVAAWQLWRRSLRRRYLSFGPSQRIVCEVPTRAWPSLARTAAVLTEPSRVTGWVVLSGGVDGGRWSHGIAGLAAKLQGTGLGTLELEPATALGLEARTERLLEALRWLGRRSSARGGTPLGLACTGVDSAPALAAACRECSISAVVVGGGHYDGLQEEQLRDMRAAVQLIVTCDEEATARLVLAALSEMTDHALAVVRGNAAGLSSRGRQEACWLAGEWLARRLTPVRNPRLAQARHARRLALAGLAVTFSPLGSLGAAWRLGDTRSGELATTAQNRMEARHLSVPPSQTLGLLSGTFELSSLDGTNGFRTNGISAGDSAGSTVSKAGDVNNDGFDDILLTAVYAAPNGSRSGQIYVVYGGSAPTAVVELSALTAATGFRLDGIATDDYSGRSASAAGDVNNDGFDDILIGAPGADPNGSSSGQSYVVYGGSDLPATLGLAALDGDNGFRVNGITSGDQSGSAVSGAGDVNGDGFADILIGAPGATPHGTYTGQIYVVYGGSSLPGTLELSALAGNNGFRVNGVSSVASGPGAGHSVSGAGDVNQDGFADILIGAHRSSPNGAYSGQAYVVYGGSVMPATVELSALDGANGFQVNGIAPGDLAGTVSGAGDVNQDGFADILVGAYSAGPNGEAFSGQSYLVYGGSGLPAVVELATLAGSSGFRINGVASSDASGRSLSGAGDVNQDGFADILLGAAFADVNGSYSGQSYVVYGGSAIPGSIDLSALNGLDGFRVNGISEGDQSGGSVSGAGDVNGDGFPDLLIGARRADPNGYSSGQAYVVFGLGVGVFTDGFESGDTSSWDSETVRRR